MSPQDKGFTLISKLPPLLYIIFNMNFTLLQSQKLNKYDPTPRETPTQVTWFQFWQVVSKKRDEFDVEYNQGRRWNYVRLPLPPYIPESHLDYCDIIEIDYIFQFRVEVSGGSELKMECPFLIGAHPQGPEVPKVSHAVNSQWTIRASGLPMLPGNNELQQQQQHADPHQDWGLVSGVPEMRGEKVVVNNPLFRQGSIMTKGVKVVPDELMENTRL